MVLNATTVVPVHSIERYGGKKITTKGLLVVKIDDQNNLIVVKGSVPGKPGSIVNIKPNNVVGQKGGKKS